MTQSAPLTGPELGKCAIPSLLAARAAEMPDDVFAIFPNVTLTYGEVDARARAVAKGLIARGVGPGTKVAVFMPSCSDWLAGYFGVLYTGAIVVALNARYKRHELAYTVEHSDTELLLTTDEIADFVDYAELLGDTFPELATARDPERLELAGAPKLRSMVMFGGSNAPGFLTGDQLCAAGADVPDAEIEARTAAIDPESVAVLMYTSGTTSNPKACGLSHAGIGRSWLTFAQTVTLARGETVWIPMPLFHTGGIGPMSAVMWRGAKFITQAHFKPEEIVQLILEHKAEHLYSGFPQFSLTVLQHPTYTRERFGFIRSMLNVGPPGGQYTIQNLLPEGAKLLNLFGMTEGSGIITFTPWDTPMEQRAVTSGRAPAHTEARVMHPETGAPCAPDEEGEIQFRGGGAFVYYYKDPKATADTIIEGGWVRTGDRGKMDADGWIYYLGRLKDMLKVGGENVAATEIEFFLNTHPEVKMVQVIGVEDDKYGEVPVAFVETAPGASVTKDELIGMCNGELAKWKIPRDIIFVTDWPMSATKVQKFRLRDLLPGRNSASA